MNQRRTANVLFARPTVVFSLLMIRLTVSRMVRWISENATELFVIQLDMLRNSISRNVHSVSHYINLKPMKLLIEKKSGKKFPPPFDGDGSTAIAVGLCANGRDPKHRQAYVLENGQFVNCDKCCIIKNFENPQDS